MRFDGNTQRSVKEETHAKHDPQNGNDETRGSHPHLGTSAGALLAAVAVEFISTLLHREATGSMWALRETLPRSPRNSSFCHRTLTRGTLLPPCLLKLAQSLSKVQVGGRRDECGRRRLSASPLRITNFPCAALTHDVARERGQRPAESTGHPFPMDHQGRQRSVSDILPLECAVVQEQRVSPPRAILGKSSRRHDLARRVGVPRVIKPGCHRGVLHEWE